MRKKYIPIFEVTILFVLISILCFLISCGKKQKDDPGELSYPLETAKIVSQVTSGFISSNDIIQIRFVSPMIQDNLVDEVLQKSVFSFQPKIEGLAKWQDQSTLIFQPNRPLPYRQIYTGNLDMTSLLPQQRDKILQPLEFTFINFETSS